MSVKALCKGNRAETEQSTRTGGDGKRSAIARLCFFGKRGRTMAAHNRISCKPPGKGQNMRAFSLQKNKLDAPFLSPRQITRKNYRNLQNSTKHLQKEGILRGHRNRITDTYKRKSRKRNGVAAQPTAIATHPRKAAVLPLRRGCYQWQTRPHTQSI